MGLEELIDVTGDVGAADAILAFSSELRQNPWICGVAKFHQLPVFVIKVISHYHLISEPAYDPVFWYLIPFIIFNFFSQIPWHKW